jgi:hypothetical protein
VLLATQPSDKSWETVILLKAFNIMRRSGVKGWFVAFLLWKLLGKAEDETLGQEVLIYNRSSDHEKCTKSLFYPKYSIE